MIQAMVSSDATSTTLETASCLISKILPNNDRCLLDHDVNQLLIPS